VGPYEQTSPTGLWLGRDSLCPLVGWPLATSNLGLRFHRMDLSSYRGSPRLSRGGRLWQEGVTMGPLGNRLGATSSQRGRFELFRRAYGVSFYRNRPQNPTTAQHRR